MVRKTFIILSVLLITIVLLAGFQYFITEDKELSSIIEPIWNHSNLNDVERHGGSFWFKIKT